MDDIFNPLPETRFKAAWWLPGPHLQTLWPSFIRKRDAIALSTERLELPDGDFLDLAWTRRVTAPIVVILHGLEGGLDSHYTTGLLAAIERQGWQGLLMHFRNCGDEPNRLDRSYHSGETGDIAYLINLLNERYPESPVAVVGFSLGGNVLLKWLGELGQSVPVTAAIAVSVPFELGKCALKLERGPSRIYQNHLMKSLRQSVCDKFANRDAPFDMDQVSHLRTFREFDDFVTAPLHGFAGVDDYYSRSSSRQYLKSIATRTLIIQAANDPFLPIDAVPGKSELGPGVQLELSPTGGHVGFVSGTPWRPEYWLEQRIPEYLANYL